MKYIFTSLSYLHLAKFTTVCTFEAGHKTIGRNRFDHRRSRWSTKAKKWVRCCLLTLYFLHSYWPCIQWSARKPLYSLVAKHTIRRFYFLYIKIFVHYSTFRIYFGECESSAKTRFVTLSADFFLLYTEEEKEHRNRLSSHFITMRNLCERDIFTIRVQQPVRDGVESIDIHPLLPFAV